MSLSTLSVSMLAVVVERNAKSTLNSIGDSSMALNLLQFVVNLPFDCINSCYSVQVSSWGAFEAWNLYRTFLNSKSALESLMPCNLGPLLVSVDTARLYRQVYQC